MIYVGDSPVTNTLSDEFRIKPLDDELAAERIERRAKPRVTEPFPVTVWGTDKTGRSFETDCVMGNISSRGAYLLLPYSMELGATMTLALTFRSSKALISGNVVRDEPIVSGQHGIALTIKEHHFI